MSYSFNTAGTSNSEAKANCAAEFAKVVEQQPIHKLDIDVHKSTAEAMIDLVRDPRDDEAILVNVSGSCYGDSNEDGEVTLNGGSVNVSVSFRPRQHFE